MAKQLTKAQRRVRRYVNSSYECRYRLMIVECQLAYNDDMHHENALALMAAEDKLRDAVNALRAADIALVLAESERVRDRDERKFRKAEQEWVKWLEMR